LDKQYFYEPSLITNQNSTNFFEELSQSLNACKRFYFSVAFINYSGLQLLLDVFKKLDNNDVCGKIITSTYLNFTDVKSLRKLSEFSNIETKIYVADRYKGFHTKGYIFEFDNYYKIIVGSSNITQSALKTNVEWNVKYITKNKTEGFAIEIINEFNDLWDLTTEINEDFLTQYESFLSEVEKFVRLENNVFENHIVLKENSMQQKALYNLQKLRENKQNKALIIAATGTGKTYLSAFDVRQFEPKRVLFLIHREVILSEAMKSYKRVHTNKVMTRYSGTEKDYSGDFVFAMIQTLYSNENYKSIPKDYFDYIIADEAHRSYSTSYRSILEYFEPKFLLGMTATPERTDGGNIFEFFNNNIALEMRLRDSLREDLVLPFHYFGISDVTTDLEDIDLSKIDEVARKLSIKDRVDFVIEKMEYYGFSGRKRKCLGFCVSNAHADFMASEFNAFGYPSISLSGESSDTERKEVIKRLENLDDKLEFIFTVDIFNEGIDIPSVNLVLMLRPTQSPIIFTQQLGRGLRKHYEKEFLTVLDFIGNHNKSFLIPIALSGSRYYDKDSLRVQLEKNFSDIPGCTNISMDEIAKEHILTQLERVNFTDMKYLREEYLEFKNSLGGKVPLLLDYVGHETAPDPVKFILKSGSYYEFVASMENKDIDLDNRILDILRSLDKQLPIKRINEFVVIKHLVSNKSISCDQAKDEILKYVNDIDDESLLHTFKYLSGKILGDREKNTFSYVSGNGKNYLELNDDSVFQNKLILETLNYGILRYQEEFGKERLTYPYLKKYEYYKMKDMGFLTNYHKSFASIRGSGVWKNGNHYYLFVDLHKGEDIQESINYKDKLLSQSLMQWETQNKTSQNSEVGKDLINNRERNIHLHMFLRKAKQIGNQKLDYIYIGEVNSLSFEGERPITIQMEIVEPLPQYIYDDLTFVKNVI
jgi:superfamily II DNA or RNA helicase/HKD family nuclease